MRTLSPSIRTEQKSDYKNVENVVRAAFWNVYIPGCFEHYLVHIMRDHADFIPDLSLVMEIDGKIIGNIMYTKSRLIDEHGLKKDIVTFGPLCILPEYQRRGYGKMLMARSFKKVMELGYDVIVIFGNPANYVSSGFKSCRKFNICLNDGNFPAAMLVKELGEHTLDGRRWVYHQSPVMEVDSQAAEDFDHGLAPWEKKYQPSQEEFYILSQSVLPS